MRPEILKAIIEEREACAAVIYEMMQMVDKYPAGSFSAEEDKNRAIYNHLRMAYVRVMERGETL
jgi:hypothetical protein